MHLDYSDCAVIFKALSDETRIRIVKMLSAGELCCCDLLEHFEITQPTLSYHLRILTESGLILSRRFGSRTFFRLNPDRTELVRSCLRDLFSGEEQPSR